MTNADKYLKDNVSVEEFINAFCMSGRSAVNGYQVYLLKDFFNEQVKQPTLTEDERVILRNIPKEYETIGKCKNGILYVTTDGKKYLYRAFGVFFNHLFQFIKERRRIFY